MIRAASPSAEKTTENRIRVMHESPKVLSFIERLNDKVLRENENFEE